MQCKNHIRSWHNLKTFDAVFSLLPLQPHLLSIIHRWMFLILCKQPTQAVNNATVLYAISNNTYMLFMQIRYHSYLYRQNLNLNRP